MKTKLLIGVNLILLILSSYLAWQNNALEKRNHRLSRILIIDSVTVVQAIKSNVAEKHNDTLSYLKSLVGSKEIPLKKMIDLENKAGRLIGKEYEKAKIPENFKKKNYPFPTYIF